MSRVPFLKDPDATLDYSFDWATWLGTDQITASVWSVDINDAVVGATSFTNTTTMAFVSGGLPGQRVTLSNRITTLGGRIDERSMTLKIRER
jgi:hypothetical protein